MQFEFEGTLEEFEVFKRDLFVSEYSYQVGENGIVRTGDIAKKAWDKDHPEQDDGLTKYDTPPHSGGGHGPLAGDVVGGGGPGGGAGSCQKCGAMATHGGLCFACFDDSLNKAPEGSIVVNPEVPYLPGWRLVEDFDTNGLIMAANRVWTVPENKLLYSIPLKDAPNIYPTGGPYIHHEDTYIYYDEKTLYYLFERIETAVNDEI
tara:strand:- start:1592 stop:2206 length:615 start_codon:yes stop_codon:yes gene_type:complete